MSVVVTQEQYFCVLLASSVFRRSMKGAEKVMCPSLYPCTLLNSPFLERVYKKREWEGATRASFTQSIPNQQMYIYSQLS